MIRGKSGTAMGRSGDFEMVGAAGNGSGTVGSTLGRPGWLWDRRDDFGTIGDDSGTAGEGRGRLRDGWG